MKLFKSLFFISLLVGFSFNLFAYETKNVFLNDLKRKKSLTFQIENNSSNQVSFFFGAWDFSDEEAKLPNEATVITLDAGEKITYEYTGEVGQKEEIEFGWFQENGINWGGGIWWSTSEIKVNSQGQLTNSKGFRSSFVVLSLEDFVK